MLGFEGFGDSCLNLVLRCYLPNFDHRLKVITQLHVNIDKRFREAGIEIAFPQRDLHIRSLPEHLAALAAGSKRQTNDMEIGDQDEDESPMKRSA